MRYMQTISLPKCMWYLVRQIHETTYDVRELTVYAVDEFYAENEVNKNGWHSTKVELAECEGCNSTGSPRGCVCT